MTSTNIALVLFLIVVTTEIPNIRNNFSELEVRYKNVESERSEIAHRALFVEIATNDTRLPNVSLQFPVKLFVSETLPHLADNRAVPRPSVHSGRISIVRIVEEL